MRQLPPAPQNEIIEPLFSLRASGNEMRPLHPPPPLQTKIIEPLFDLHANAKNEMVAATQGVEPQFELPFVQWEMRWSCCSTSQ